MKTISQLEAYKSVRKTAAPGQRAFRDKSKYNRKQKHRKQHE